MPVHNQNRISRRAAIVGALSSWAFLPTLPVKAKQAERPAPVHLGHGLEIRDYRLFPTKDVMRFIVEIHNTTDTAIDTPTVGVELPNLAGENFGWANPFAGVIHPHSSQGLLGLAPLGLSSDDQWGSPAWTLCDEVRTEAAEIMQDWNIEVSCESHILDSDDLATQVIITNKDESRLGPFSVQGLMWDQDSRLCGGSLYIAVERLDPEESRELWIHIEPNLNYAANPFAIIESVEQLEPRYSLQPANAINKGCPVVMPSYDNSK